MFDGFPAIFGIIPDFEARQFRASLAETSKRMDEKTFTLYRNAYGASRADIQRVGGTGDGGIDGVISLDKLGLEKVYVQAKRWQGTVACIIHDRFEKASKAFPENQSGDLPKKQSVF